MRERISQSRSERLIAVGRWVLAVASLVAVYADPIEPATNVAFVYALLGFYALYSTWLVGWNFWATDFDPRSKIITHVIDLVFFVTLNSATGGAPSPFFAFFIFSAMCAILRFGRRGTVLTLGLAIVAFFTSGIHAAMVAPDAFELNRFIIRTTYLTIAAALLFYLASYQERLQAELSRLALWQPSQWRNHDDLVSDILEAASTIMSTDRVLLAYETRSELSCHFGRRNGTDFLVEKLDDNFASRVLPLDGDASLSRRGIGAVSSSLGDRSVALEHDLPAELADRIGEDKHLASAFTGELVRGRIFFLDRQSVLQEDVVLARVVASTIAARLDHYHAMRHVQRGAIAQERVRVGRDLHDSLLQSLTGVALQLRTLPKLMTRDHAAASERVGEIEQVIGNDQRELRAYIDHLHGEGYGSVNVLYDVRNRLETLVTRFRQQWALEVECKVEGLFHLVSAPLQAEVYSIVSEAVANAAKHAGATRVKVSILAREQEIVLRMSDDGHGFPFRGRFDLQQLADMSRGPVTLKERVSALRGELVIDSSPTGAILEAKLPLFSTEAPV